MVVAVLAIATLMNSADSNTNEDFRQLTRTLANAYGNAIRHNASEASLESSLESEDLNLENASIRLSGLIAHEIAASCADSVERTSAACVLEEQSVNLRNVADMLSYAASHLENQGRMAGERNALHRVHVRSLEHLYRTLFALAKSYFDRAQSDGYLKAAHEQINLARNSLETEHQLCSCNDPNYIAKLDELAHLDSAVLNITRKGSKSGAP